MSSDIFGTNSTYYGYGNSAAGKSVSPWTAILQSFAHPIDTVRADLGGTVAYVGGKLVQGAEYISGINTPLLSDLPGQSNTPNVSTQNQANVVSATLSAQEKALQARQGAAITQNATNYGNIILIGGIVMVTALMLAKEF